MADQKDIVFGVPTGECRTENPDGVTFSNGFDPHHNLRDETGHPLIKSGDWQANWRPGLQPRGRP